LIVLVLRSLTAWEKKKGRKERGSVSQKMMQDEQASVVSGGRNVIRERKEGGKRILGFLGKSSFSGGCMPSSSLVTQTGQRKEE